MSKHVKLDHIIDRYLEVISYDAILHREGSNLNNVKELVAQAIRDDIEKEILEKYSDRMINELKIKNNEFRKRQNFRQTIILLLETVMLSGFIGLLVNQCTDIISFLKGQNINLVATAIVIIILLLVTLVFLLFVYLDKFSEWFGMDDKEWDHIELNINRIIQEKNDNVQQSQ